MQLQTYAQWITLFQQSGGNISAFHQQYLTAAQMLETAHTQNDYMTELGHLRAHITAIELPVIKEEANHLAQQFQQAVSQWEQKHTFYNSYDGVTYPLGYEYAENGVGGWLQDDLASAQTLSDYQQVIETIAMYSTNFQAMKENAGSKTPYNQVHQTDEQLLKRYNAHGKVLVVSLEEQAARVYNQDKLVNAFLVTTGRPDRPSPPGKWEVETKLSPTVFRSGVPQGSPDWYPDTPIHYALQYHSAGYFIHDSWWRNDYGPGTNYPHADSSGDSFSYQGSHGCINVAENDAAWVYNYLDLNSTVIVY